MKNIVTLIFILFTQIVVCQSINDNANLKAEIEFHLQQAKKYTYINLDSAIHYTVSGIKIIDKLNSSNLDKKYADDKKVDFLLRHAMLLQGQHDLGNSILKYEQALKLAAKVKKESVSQIKVNYFSAKIQRGDRALYHEISDFRNKIDLISENNISSYIMLSYLLARSYANEDDLENAVYTLVDVLNLIDKYPKNKKYLSGTLNSIAIYLNDMGYDDKAEAFLKNALNLNKEKHFQHQLTLNLAWNSFKKNNLKLCEDYLNSINEREIIATQDYFTYLFLRYKLSPFDVRKDIVHSLDSIFLHIEDRDSKLLYYQIKSKHHFDLNEFNTAMVYLDSMDKLNENTVGFVKVKNESVIIRDRLRYLLLNNNDNPIINLFDKYEILRDTIEKLKINSKTSEILEKYESVQKEIANQVLKNKNLSLLNSNNLLLLRSEKEFNEKRAIEISNLKLDLELKSVDSIKTEITHRNNLLEKESFYSQKNIRNKNNLIAIALVFILLILGLLIYVWKQNKAKSKLNQMLTKQNSQIQLLNRELNHRVKNNLAFMTSLLEMQGRRTDNIETRQLLRESETRLKTLALVHANLFKNELDTHINLSSYLTELVSHLEAIFAIPGKSIEMDTRLTDFTINAEDAMRLGLIVNELVTNSIKHAFDEVDNPIITIHTFVNGEGKLVLDYKDNGPGIMTAVTPGGASTGSLGTKLISLLKAQLGDRYVVMV